jgi:hypothetical protein
MIDAIVDRRELKPTIARALRFGGAVAAAPPVPAAEPSVVPVTQT